nr:TetR/AcrR family transcriptional regulator [Mycobacterium uberis]
MLSVSTVPLETVERIPLAVVNCVVNFGVDQVTFAKLARRVGVSRSTVYRR